MGAIRRALQRVAHRTLWSGERRSYASGYAGSGGSSLIRNWAVGLLSANETLRGDIDTLRARARALVQNSGEAEGVASDLAIEVAGHSGAQLQVRFRNNRNRLRDEINGPLEREFRRWSRLGVCTSDGAHDFASLQRLVIRTVVVDGEFFAFRVRGRGVYSYEVQPFDADRVDHTYTQTLTSGNRVVMGVELNAQSRPVAYHIWERHPSESDRGVRQRIDARNVLHVFRRLRPEQTRGVTWFAPALLHWKAAEKHTEAELMASIVAAAQGGFFEAEEWAAPIDPPKDDQGNPKPFDMSAEPGLSRVLPYGYKFNSWTPSHPTTTFGGFMKVVKRMISRALLRSYHAVTGDLESVNFSSLRSDRLREMDVNRMLQAELLVAQFCEPTLADWAEMAALQGLIPSVDPAALWDNTRWQCRGWDWVDPLKEAQAAAIELALGTTTRSRIAAAKGLDFYELIDERAQEDRYATEAGVALSTGPNTYTIVAGGSTAEDTTTTPVSQEPTRDLRVVA